MRFNARRITENPFRHFPSHTLFEGDSLQIPGTQRSVLYERFVPTVDKQSGPAGARSARHRSGGRFLRSSMPEIRLGSAVVPLKTWVDLGSGWRIIPQQYVLYSGLQYRYDPGVPLVAIGALHLAGRAC